MIEIPVPQQKVFQPAPYEKHKQNRPFR